MVEAGLRYRSEFIDEHAPCGFESNFFADAGEHIRDLALLCGGLTHSVGCKQRQPQSARHVYHRVIAGLFFSSEMSLQFGVDIALAEYSTSRAAVAIASSKPPFEAQPPGVRLHRRSDKSSPSECAATSSIVAAPSPFFARSFIKVTRRQRF